MHVYKIRRIEDGVELFDGLNYYDRVKINKTTWEIIKTVRKYGKERAVEKLVSQFNIDKKNAKEDIATVLTNFKTLNIPLEEIPKSVSNVKYAPRTVHIDITPRCNSNCIYCLASERMADPNEMSTEQVLNIINQLPELGTWLLCISGGEPLLRKDLFKVLDYAEKLKLLTQLFTNGMLCTKEVAEKFSKLRYLFLQVSLDSYIPEHHDFNRGYKGAYEKTLQGIKNLLEYKVDTEICMVLTKKNYKDLEESAAFLHKLGISYIRIGPAHPYCGKGYSNKDKLELTVDQWRWIGKKIIELNKNYEGSMRFLPTRQFIVYAVTPSQSEKLRKCANGRGILYIRPNGLVYPCIFSVFPEFNIGDAKKETLSHIWKTSSIIKKIRYLTVDDIEKCKTCDVKHLCTGGCRASSYYHFGTLFSHDPLFCAFYGK